MIHHVERGRETRQWSPEPIVRMTATGTSQVVHRKRTESCANAKNSERRRRTPPQRDQDCQMVLTLTEASRRRYADRRAIVVAAKSDSVAGACSMIDVKHRRILTVGQPR